MFLASFHLAWRIENPTFSYHGGVSAPKSAPRHSHKIAYIVTAAFDNMHVETTSAHLDVV